MERNDTWVDLEWIKLSGPHPQAISLHITSRASQAIRCINASYSMHLSISSSFYSRLSRHRSIIQLSHHNTSSFLAFFLAFHPPFFPNQKFPHPNPAHPSTDQPNQSLHFCFLHPVLHPALIQKQSVGAEINCSKNTRRSRCIASFRTIHHTLCENAK